MKMEKPILTCGSLKGEEPDPAVAGSCPAALAVRFTGPGRGFRITQRKGNQQGRIHPGVGFLGEIPEVTGANLFEGKIDFHKLRDRFKW